MPVSQADKPSGEQELCILLIPFFLGHLMLKERLMEVRTRETAPQFYWHRPWAAISIAEDSSGWPWIQEENRVALLQILIRHATSEHQLLYGGYSDCCDRAKAIQVMDFLYGVWDRIDTLLVQCKDGCCASAVVSALSYITGQGTEKDYSHFHPNHIVYTMLLKAHYDRYGWRS